MSVAPTCAPAPSPQTDDTAKVLHLSAIAERNLFGVRREVTGGGPAGLRSVRTCDGARSAVARACTGWQLRGTIVGDEPSWSVAVGQGVVPLASGDFEVSRAEMDRVRANLHQELERVRLVPVRGGFKVLRLKPDSILARVGLKNGDVLRTVDGHALATPGELAGLYGQLDSLSSVTVGFTRRGRAESRRLTIVD